MTTREEAVRLARALIAENETAYVLPDALSFAHVILALDERVRVLEALLSVLGDRDPDDRFEAIKVFREEVPQLFSDEDGNALYAPDAIKRALATGEGKEG